MVSFYATNAAAKKPVGIVQIVQQPCKNIEIYDNLINMFNRYGFAVCMRKRNINNDDVDCFKRAMRQEIKTLRYIKNKYKAPVFLFGWGDGGLIAQQIMTTDSLCDGGACVPSKFDMPGLRHNFTRAMLYFKKLSGREFKFQTARLNFIRKMQHDGEINKPCLIISAKDNMRAMNKTMGNTLYNLYGNHNLDKLTLIMYPETSNWQDLTPESTYIQQDVVDFINRVRYSMQ